MSVDFQSPSRTRELPTAFLRTGFRPFFFGAALHACFALVVWIGTLHGAPILRTRFTGSDWHSHEMVFGYTLAVVAGFLLTAVRNWSGGRETAKGSRLGILFAAWVAGRVTGAASATMPWWIPAVLDVAFPFAAGIVIAGPLWAARRRADLGFSVWFAAMGLLSGVAHVATARGVEGVTAHVSTLGVALTMLLIVVIAGRIIPNFTRFHLKIDTIRANPLLNWFSVLSVGSLPILSAIDAETALGIMAFVAAGTNLARLWTWKPWRALRSPMLLILHIAYLWLSIGFGLRGWYALVGGATPSSATHALTIGALGTLTLGMMGWVGLAHTGRPVKASRTMVFAYASITAAAFIRVVGPIALPAHYIALLGFSGTLWVAAFAAYLAAYTGPLFSPAANKGSD